MGLSMQVILYFSLAKKICELFKLFLRVRGFDSIHSIIRSHLPRPVLFCGTVSYGPNHRTAISLLLTNHICFFYIEKPGALRAFDYRLQSKSLATTQ